MNPIFLPNPIAVLPISTTVRWNSGSSWANQWLWWAHQAKRFAAAVNADSPARPSPMAWREIPLFNHTVAIVQYTKPLRTSEVNSFQGGMVLAKRTPEGLKPYWFPIGYTGGPERAIMMLYANRESINALIEANLDVATTRDEAFQGKPVSPILPLDLTATLQKHLDQGTLIDSAILAVEQVLNIPNTISHVSLKSSTFRPGPTTWNDLYPASAAVTMPFSVSKSVPTDTSLKAGRLIGALLQTVYNDPWDWFGQDLKKKTASQYELESNPLGIHTRADSLSAHTHIDAAVYVPVLESLIETDPKRFKPEGVSKK